MELIEYKKIKSGIGIDIGDGIMNFIIKNNCSIPEEKQIKLIKEYHNDYSVIKLYHGDNILTKNNILLGSFIIKTNKLLFIKIKLLSINCFLINVFYKDGNKILLLYKFNNNKIEKIIEECNIDQLKLLYVLDNNINIALKKINKTRFPDNLKKSIKINLINLKNNFHLYENQILIEKINNIKKKFLI